MRVLFALLVLLIATPTLADAAHDRLYDAAGWGQQREHFQAALAGAQQRYQASLPPALYQTLVNNSNRRFAAEAMDRRARDTLAAHLADPQPALRFFESPLGRKAVAAETLATRSDQLAQHAGGLPRIEADATRRLLIRHLAQALPVREAGAEVSLALAGVAADSLSQMLPGLLGNGGARGALDGQRQQLMEQIGNDLDNTLLYVYRDLSDPELEEFSTFAESAEGKAYYQAALEALRAALGP